MHIDIEYRKIIENSGGFIGALIAAILGINDWHRELLREFKEGDKILVDVGADGKMSFERATEAVAAV